MSPRQRLPAGRAGEGLTAALLRRHGVQVFSEHELDAAAAALQQLIGR